MRLATFNANSIRMRQGIILDWLEKHQPDVLAIQETKVEDASFPEAAFRDAGWHVAKYGQKMRNGVALLSKEPMLDITTGFDDPDWPEDCRIITGVMRGTAIVNTYVPNGTEVGTEKFEYKLRWMERFRRYLDERFKPGDPFVWLGDVNVAPTPDDVYDSKRLLGKVGHHPDEFAALKRIIDTGLCDLFRKHTQGPGHYTFWEFYIPKSFERNLGWRIDHIYAPSKLAETCSGCFIDENPRALEKPSDHTFVFADLEMR
jgi:exodeoxyribonuclease-3